MWGASKPPISSPGRADKYPPTVMRFLRSNVGSRSRGRSRASPMFVRKRLGAGEAPEPSSPEVTCMGQVRVMNRAKKPEAGRRCRWFRTALFCHSLTGKLRPARWPKWASFSSYFGSSGGRAKSRESSRRSEPLGVDRSRSVPEYREFGYSPERARLSVSTTATNPPRNALLLTRSRSAPYRSSSLAYRFWESPLASEEESKPETARPRNGESEDSYDDEGEEEDEAKVKQEPESGENSRNAETTEGARKEIEGSTADIQIGDKPENPGRMGSPKPLLLMRCKSVPARIGEKLDTVEVEFWRKKQRSNFSLE